MQQQDSQAFAKSASVMLRAAPGLEEIGPRTREHIAARERRLFTQWNASTVEMSALLLQVMSAMGTPAVRKTGVVAPASPLVAAVPAPPGLEFRLGGGAVLKHIEAAQTEDMASTNDSGTRDFAEIFSDNESEAGAKMPASPTTLMVRNIPKDYTEEMLLREWPPSLGFDFFYLPRNKRGQASLGYAFLNFVSAQEAEAFQERWNKRRLPQFEAPKKLNISLAEVQGLEANVRALKQKPEARMKARQCEPIIFREGRRLTLDDL